ncbi:MAG TPA: hypothetical protein DEB39_01990 [Planctomycetaceae bacterium]|nr:hypothetical protein [Planctomycetaceae bacterium]
MRRFYQIISKKTRFPTIFLLFSQDFTGVLCQIPLKRATNRLKWTVSRGKIRFLALFLYFFLAFSLPFIL